VDCTPMIEQEGLGESGGLLRAIVIASLKISDHNKRINPNRLTGCDSQTKNITQPLSTCWSLPTEPQQTGTDTAEIVLLGVTG
jgi:hypothetical protein